MGSIKVDTVVEKDGVINMKVSGLPFKKGQEVKVTFKAKEKSAQTKRKSPAKYPFPAREGCAILRSSLILFPASGGVSWRGLR
jgi:hypothetical protein